MDKQQIMESVNWWSDNASQVYTEQMERYKNELSNKYLNGLRNVKATYTIGMDEL